MREMEEEKRTVKMTGLSKQGAQIDWEVPERRVSSMDIIRGKPWILSEITL